MIIRELTARVRIQLAVKTPYFWRSAIPGKYPEVPILPEDGSSQKEKPG
jgi:hypothetical protein